MDFDPGAGTVNLVSSGLEDAFLTKLNSSGDFVWVQKFGSGGSEVGQYVDVDTDGNVYVTGTFDGTIDFDSGVGTANLVSAGVDIFILKLNSDGNFVWVKQMGGAGNEYVPKIEVDSGGNVYTSGSFSGTADFDPGAGTVNLTSAGATDAFISKLNSAGDFVWVKQLGGTGSDIANEFVLDSELNIYVIGDFSGTIDSDPGAGTVNLTSAGATDIFILKLDSAGNFVWSKQMGGTGSELSFAMGIDDNANIYGTGGFQSTVDFDPGAGTTNLVSAGSYDVFISKLDSDGNFVWAKLAGGTGLDVAREITADLNHNVYTIGQFQNTVDFDPGAGTVNLTSAGSSDVFISKLDSDGNFVWIKQFGGVSLDTGTSLEITSIGEVISTGYFSSATIDFDPGAGTANLNSAGSHDIFISKLSDVTSPTTSSLSPADEDTDVSITTNLAVTFDEEVNVGTGNIVIYKALDDSVFETIDVTSGNVTGGGTTTITINPTTNLNYETAYYIQTDATAFDDLNGNSYAGIADETTWNFTTLNAPSRGSSSGSRPKPNIPEYTPTPTTASVICNTGDKFSSTTGLPCTSFVAPPVATSLIPVCPIIATLDQGSTGEEVECLQTILQNLVIDGIFGPMTKAAVITFQASKGLMPDGIVGPLTRGALGL